MGYSDVPPSPLTLFSRQVCFLALCRIAVATLPYMLTRTYSCYPRSAARLAQEISVHRLSSAILYNSLIRCVRVSLLETPLMACSDMKHWLSPHILLFTSSTLLDGKYNPGQPTYYTLPLSMIPMLILISLCGFVPSGPRYRISTCHYLFTESQASCMLLLM